MPPPTHTVYRLLRALRARDESAVGSLLHPEVAATGARGLKRGPDEVVAWAKPTTEGHLVSSVEVDEILPVGDEWVAVGARRLWTWQETGDVADAESFGVLFRVEGDLVIHWDQTFASITEAIESIPA